MLVTSDEQPDHVKIVDFGIAKLICQDAEENQLTLPGEVFGSPPYMSPCQCDGKPMDARSDIYSMGCIMYRTVSGYPAISGGSFQECRYEHVNTIPRCFKNICPELNLPEAIETLIEQCMAKDPGNRFQSMLDLKVALEALQLALEPSIIQGFHYSPEVRLNPAGQSAGAQKTTGLLLTANDDNELKIFRCYSKESIAEAHRAASVAEAGFVVAAAEVERAAAAAEVERAAESAEVKRAAESAEVRLAAAAAVSAGEFL
jgi:serine/threonine protein kinase